MKESVAKRFSPFSDMQIEEYLCGDATESESAEIESAMANNPSLSAHIQERRAEDAAFYTLHPTLELQETGSISTWFENLLNHRNAMGGLLAAALSVCIIYVGIQQPDPSLENNIQMRALSTLAVSLQSPDDASPIYSVSEQAVAFTVQGSFPARGLLVLLAWEQGAAEPTVLGSQEVDPSMTGSQSFSVPGTQAQSVVIQVVLAQPESSPESLAQIWKTKGELSEPHVRFKLTHDKGNK